MLPAPFELLLFHRTLKDTRDLLAAGVTSSIVDFEVRGKQARQQGYDTEINAQTIADLRDLRGVSTHPILCRISGPEAPAEEIESIIQYGADEIIIPMVRDPAQVERIRKVVVGRCKICVMIETTDAADNAAALCAVPADRIYVGLNDLHIERGSRSIFAPLADGFLDRIREQCRDVPFGFGGLTLPNCGAPIQATHLFAEMARLECSFTFLRRSFYRDIAGKDYRDEVSDLKAAMQEAQGRTTTKIAQQQQGIITAITQLEGLADA